MTKKEEAPAFSSAPTRLKDLFSIELRRKTLIEHLQIQFIVGQNALEIDKVNKGNLDVLGKHDHVLFFFGYLFLFGR